MSDYTTEIVQNVYAPIFKEEGICINLLTGWLNYDLSVTGISIYLQFNIDALL